MTDKYHHGDLRQTLIRKGMEMLAHEGIEKFSMRKLATEVGVSHTAPYRHFKNKEEAVKTILMENSAAFTEALRVSPEKPEEGEETDGMERLIQLGIRYVNLFLENPEFFKFFTIISDQASILKTLFPINNPNPGFCHNSGSITPHELEMEVHGGKAEYEALGEDSSYGIFRGIAATVFNQFPGLSEREVLLGYWSKVHGLSSLLIAQPDYIPAEKRAEVIEKLMRTPF